MLRKLLLFCGILSSLLYAAITALVAMHWEDYRSASQTISELSAIGAPTRTLWVVLCIPYTLLVTAFGWGVLASASGNRPLRVAGALLLLFGALGIFWPFAPMHVRGAPFSLTDAMHIALSGVTVLLMLLAIGFGAAALGKRFRLYSLATMAIVLVFGALTGMDGPRIAANLPTPWIGVWERISLAGFLLWVAVLAAVVLCADAPAREGSSGQDVPSRSREGYEKSPP